MHTYSMEIMDVLRNLNWLEKERRCLTEGGTTALLVEKQMATARAELPHSVLCLHERFAARGKPSVVRLAGSSCSACHLKLPSGELGMLRVAGRYGICPNCGVFVWSGEEQAGEPAVVIPAKASSKRRVHAEAEA